MTYSLDATTDYSNKELYQFLSNTTLPEFVKEASLDVAKDDGLFPKQAFADELGRKFLINSPAAVYVSNAHFINKQAELARIRGPHYVKVVGYNIKQAAEILGITDEIKAYNSELNTKEAADPTIYITADLGDKEVDLFTLKTASDVTYYSNEFVRNINDYPFQWRRNVASQFVKAAYEHELDELPDLLMKYAGEFFFNGSVLEAELGRRITKLSGKAKEKYQQNLDSVEKIASVDEAFDLVQNCYEIEKEAGLYTNKYNRQSLGDIVDRTFTLSLEKVSAILEDTISMGGELFSCTELEKVSKDKYEEAFGFYISPKSAEAKDVYPTLPKSDVNFFKEISKVRPL